MRTEGREILFASTAPGLEAACAAELRGLGLAAVATVPGGVEFAGGLREIYLANLWLRTATRVLVRVGSVRARAFPELFGKTASLPWGRFIRPDTPVRVRAASHRSRLLHSGRIGETVAASIDRALGRPGAPDGEHGQLVLARFEGDLCQLSVDSSGELLHRRGWRQEGGAAPLRETLAAALLFLLGWDGEMPLVDPLCGSGTLVIEAALLARRLPPGRERSFAFMAWPGFRPGLWQALLAEAGKRVRPATAPILGSDRDGGVVDIARANAGRAQVAEDIEFRCQELASLALPSSPGLLVCNPPYGERLGAREDLLPLFRQLGDAVRQADGWRLAFLAPDERLARATGLPLRAAANLTNGGIPVVLFRTGE